MKEMYKEPADILRAKNQNFISIWKYFAEKYLLKQWIKHIKNLHTFFLKKVLKQTINNYFYKTYQKIIK